MRQLLLQTAIFALAGASPLRIGAQSQARSPITDMIESAKNSLNNLQYVEARTTSREILDLRLKRSQEISALQVAAASYYPDDNSARVPDTATMYIRRLVRLMPTGQLPTDIASPGLDSLLVATRRSVFGATARFPASITLKGTERRLAIDVISTRPARWQLYFVSGDGGAAVLVDTLGSTTAGKLSLQAHNGVNPLIQPGSGQFRIISISATEPDTIVLRMDAVGKGAVPALAELPPPIPASRLLPERASRAVAAGVVAAILGGGGAWALANLAKPPKALGDEPNDGRGLAVGIGISAGVIAAVLLDRGRTLPANIKANAAARTEHLKTVGDVTETNRKRVAEYVVDLVIDQEIK